MLLFIFSVPCDGLPVVQKSLKHIFKERVFFKKGRNWLLDQSNLISETTIDPDILRAKICMRKDKLHHFSDENTTVTLKLTTCWAVLLFDDSRVEKLKWTGSKLTTHWTIWSPESSKCTKRTNFQVKWQKITARGGLFKAKNLHPFSHYCDTKTTGNRRNKKTLA